MADVEAIHVRLLSIEERLAWLRLCVMFLAVIAIIALVYLVISQGRSPDSLDLNVIRIRHSDGRIAAKMGVVDGRPLVTLRDAYENIRIALEVEADGPFVTLYDEAGKVRALLGLADPSVGAYMSLFDKDGRMLWRTPR